MDMVLAHAAELTGVPEQRIEVTRSEAVTWPDGSLGCPEPGMFYTQAVEPGYWVELEVEGQMLDYRLTENGSFKLCESGIPGMSPGEASTGDSTDDAIGGTRPGPPDA